ncbi:16S rRNA pseudouridine(516) synthase [Ideonella livida]|uniref:Ribosomal small subunit pseudouridine synthase A n=1 Tax=Ideonella livida TaxID=2707176 RepID=A0A7C9TI90_9BURK|nr:16S rRNA pseudouridine(516) synthase [Ideonella livida]NDY90202.1 pseudouridine synthase [Ideonella livida]
MKLSQILFSQGFGTRRACEGLVWNELVRLGTGPDARLLDDPHEDLPTEGLVLTVEGKPWPFHAKALVLLHKPAGYECSQKPKHHPSVMTLLPAPLRNRGVQPIGRLDEDTTGLLLLTEDGTLIHKLTSPKHHVPKVYEVRCKHPVEPAQVQRLLDGVVLDDDPAPVRAAACEAVDTHHLRLTLTEGKYHQVKRMIAAIGNRCEGLHRSAFGHLTIPAALAPGQWCWVDGWQPPATPAAPAPQA